MSTRSDARPSDTAALPLTAGRLSQLAFEGDGIEVRYYAPKGNDPQTPHDRDEFYFVASGTGTFEREDERVHVRTRRHAIRSGR